MQNTSDSENVSYQGLRFSVKLIDQNGSVIASTVSNANGAYNMSIEPTEGLYRLEAKAIGTSIELAGFVEIKLNTQSTELIVDIDVSTTALALLIQELQILNSPAAAIPVALYSTEPQLISQVESITQAVTAAVGTENLEQNPDVLAAVSNAIRQITHLLIENPQWIGNTEIVIEKKSSGSNSNSLKDPVPKTPELDLGKFVWVHSGDFMMIDGVEFDRDNPANNVIRFTQGLNSVDVPGLEFDGFKLKIAAPSVSEGGAYDVSVSVNGSPFNPQGTAILNILNVKENAGAYNALSTNGKGWSRAISLQSALAIAEPGVQIWVAAGMYKPVVPVDPSNLSLEERQTSFQLKSGVDVYGGFAGTEHTLEDRNFETNVTILSGDIDNGLDNFHYVPDLMHPENFYHENIGNNSWHVVKGADDAILDGFTIQSGGYGEGLVYGSGLYNENCSPTLNNLRFYANSLGGLYNLNSDPVLTNVSFEENINGGMRNDNSNPELNDVDFIENIGGGVYNINGSRLVLNDGRFIDNSGGGMYSLNSGFELNDVEFSGNFGTSGAGLYTRNDTDSSLTNVEFTDNETKGIGAGGGLYNYLSALELTDVTFEGNTASTGGGFYNHQANTILNNVAFINNSAVYASDVTNGGGMSNVQSTPVLNNVIFYGNSADYGGGLFNAGGNPVLTNVSFSSNTAVNNGEGLMTYASPDTPVMTNVLIWNNNMKSYGPGNSFPIVDHVVDVGQGNVVALSDPFVDNANHDLHLKSSIAEPNNALIIAQGVTSRSGITIPLLDFVGITRGAQVDVGAYEFN